MISNFSRRFSRLQNRYQQSESSNPSSFRRFYQLLSNSKDLPRWSLVILPLSRTIQGHKLNFLSRTLVISNIHYLERFCRPLWKFGITNVKLNFKPKNLILYCSFSAKCFKNLRKKILKNIWYIENEKQERLSGNIKCKFRSHKKQSEELLYFQRYFSFWFISFKIWKGLPSVLPDHRRILLNGMKELKLKWIFKEGWLRQFLKVCNWQWKEFALWL